MSVYRPTHLPQRTESPDSIPSSLSANQRQWRRDHVTDPNASFGEQAFERGVMSWLDASSWLHQLKLSWVGATGKGLWRLGCAAYLGSSAGRLLNWGGHAADEILSSFFTAGYRQADGGLTGKSIAYEMMQGISARAALIHGMAFLTKRSLALSKGPAAFLLQGALLSLGDMLGEWLSVACGSRIAAVDSGSEFFLRFIDSFSMMGRGRVISTTSKRAGHRLVGQSLDADDFFNRLESTPSSTIIHQYQPTFLASQASAPARAGKPIRGAGPFVEPATTKYERHLPARQHARTLMEHTSSTPHFVFACTGNTHRSASMHLHLAHAIQKADMSHEVQVSSFGTATFEGSVLDPDVVRLASEAGIDQTLIENFNPQPMTAQTVESATVIIAASEYHRQDIARAYPQASDKIFLFNELAPKAFRDESLDIPDPIGSIKEIEKTFAAIGKGINSEDFFGGLRLVVKRDQNRLTLIDSVWSRKIKSLLEGCDPTQIDKLLLTATRDGFQPNIPLKALAAALPNLPADWSPALKLKFMLFMAQIDPYQSSRYFNYRTFFMMFFINDLLNSGNLTAAERTQVTQYLQTAGVEALSSQDAANTMTTYYWRRQKYAGLLAVSSFLKKTPPLQKAPAQKELSQLVQDQNWVTARDLVRCMEAAQIHVKSSTRKSVERNADLEMERRTNRRERAIHWQPKKLSNEMARFYTIQGIARRLDQAKCFKLSPQAKEATLHLEETFKRETQNLLEWLRQYLVVIVNDELQLKDFSRHPVSVTRPWLVPFQEETTMHRFLKWGTPEEIRMFLARASDCFTTGDWSNKMGGQPWVAIAQAAYGLWQSDTPDRALMDHVFDLSHYTGSIFSKKRDYLLDAGLGYRRGLDIKSQATDVESLIDQATYSITTSEQTRLGSWLNQLHKIEAEINSHPVTDVLHDASGLDTASGTAISKGATPWVSGKTCFDTQRLEPGDILVRPLTVPRDFRALQKAGGVITTQGGVLSHAAIICREAQKPGVILHAAEILPGTNTLVWKSDSDIITIEEGDWVRVHGTTGEIDVVKQDQWQSLNGEQKAQLWLEELMGGAPPYERALENLEELKSLDPATLTAPAQAVIFRATQLAKRILQNRRLDDGYATQQAQQLMDGIQRVLPFAQMDQSITAAIEHQIALKKPQQNKPAPVEPQNQKEGPDHPQHYLFLDLVDQTDVNQVGGKMARLGDMRKLYDLQVPHAVGLTPRLFFDYLDEKGDRQRFTTLTENLEQALQAGHDDQVTALAAEIRQLILTPRSKAPSDIFAIIQNAPNDLIPGPFAVRSSAISEDSKTASHAGMAATILDVDYDNLPQAVTQVWASFFSDHAIYYRHDKGISQRDFKPAVMLQQMVKGDVSGVLFSRDPVSGEQINVISAKAGLGTAVVEGTAPTDLYRFDGLHIEIENQVGRKRLLSRSLIAELSHIASRAERHFGFPVDIEFTVKNRMLYLLQVRPITSIN